MSTKNTASDNVDNTTNGAVTSSLKSSPLLGWLAAGSDLIAAKLDTAAGMVSQRIDDTHEAIQTMQAKGLEVESELKRTLNPMAIVDTAQKLVMANPVVSVLSGSKKRQKKDEQLALLNAKVDLLVEQVALLAAKEAAAKVESKPKATKRTTRNTTRTSAKDAGTTDSAKTTTTAKATSTAKTTSSSKASAGKASSTRKPNTAAKRTNSTAVKKPATRKSATKAQTTNTSSDKSDS